MDNQIKALLLGVDLWWNGDGPTQAKARRARLMEALGRLTLHTDFLRPDTLQKMLGNGEDAIEWLAEHPNTKLVIGYWSVTITSQNFEDVDFERYDWPFDMNGAVEDFSKSKAGADGWECCWSLA